MAGWSQERDDELKRLFERGLSFSRIGAEMGMSRCAVLGRSHRLGLPRRGAGNKPPLEKQAKPIRRSSTSKVRLAMPMMEQIRLRCVEVVPLHVSLLDLAPGQCRYPYGDGPFTFCGHPASIGPYCMPHLALSIGAGTSSEQVAHRISRRVA